LVQHPGVPPDRARPAAATGAPLMLESTLAEALAQLALSGATELPLRGSQGEIRGSLRLDDLVRLVGRLAALEEQPIDA
ncbi:MAG: hypothetical protein KGR26_08340, partial [Cyanobacteria bacterium REEB65]|nr:hypothetical protein [Cyanobacteria bacterium REEB65]